MTDAAQTGLTQDAFLGGKVHVAQPQKGFRSGVDAVLLAAAVPAAPGETTLELGCGVGVASLCLAARVPDLTLHGVEVQHSYAALARRNVTANHARMQIHAADLRALPAELRQLQFAQVFMNPPYFDRSMGPAARDDGRDLALAGDTPLHDWIDVGIKRLASKGVFTLIQHISRLPEVLVAAQGRLGSLTVLPIAGRVDTPPNLFVLQGRHSGKQPFSLQKTCVLHDGSRHDGDRESYTAEVRKILRDGAPLIIGD